MNRQGHRHTLVALVAACIPLSGASAATPTAAIVPDQPLVVGTKSAPPFAIRNPDGSWRGMSIELWRGIAADLDIEYRFRETDLDGLLAGVRDGELDAAVAALTVTSQRERQFDFTHPFHTTGLGIAAVATERGGWLAAVRRVFSWGFIKVVLILLAVLLAVGAMVWLAERKRNPEQFGGNPVKGMASGPWWSAVTMTTVGYGDKAPRTWVGRLAAIVWMFAGIILIASFTAMIITALTVSQLETAIRGPEDLVGKEVGTVAGSTSDAYLQRRRIDRGHFPSPAEALGALQVGKIDAVVYDAPILKYLVKTQYPGDLAVLPQTFERQDYAIALPEDSPLREAINRAILQRIRSPQWEDVRYCYLGR